MEIKVTCDIQNRVDYKSLVPTQGELKSLSKENYNRFKKSVIKYGIHSPCAVWNNSGVLQTLDGHQRCLGFGKMESEGYKIPLIPIYTIDAPDLKTAKEILLTLVSQYGHIEGQGLYEFTTLAGLDLEFLKDMTDLPGLDLNKYEAEFYKEINKGQCDEDEVPEKVEPKTKLGDLYLLGEHRLLCGDSTDITQVEKLMNGENADITFTSPPYNLGDNAALRGKNASGEKSAYRTESDHKTQEEYLSFLVKWTSIAIKHCQYVFSNIQILAGNKFILSDYWQAFKSNLVDIMIWDKEHAQPAAAERVLNSVWEFIFIFSDEHEPKRSIKTGPEFRGTIDNIYRLNPVGKKDELAKDHRAVFPVQFAETFIKNFSEKSVLDLFGGSGSTLIACEKTNRKCFMMELDPHYCSVIIERWRKYTGKEAYRVEPNGDQTPWSKITI